LPDGSQREPSALRFDLIHRIEQHEHSIKHDLLQLDAPAIDRWQSRRKLGDRRDVEVIS